MALITSGCAQGFACFWIAVVEHVQQAAPAGVRGTAQSVVSTCWYAMAYSCNSYG